MTLKAKTPRELQDAIVTWFKKHAREDGSHCHVWDEEPENVELELDGNYAIAALVDDLLEKP